MLRRLFLFLLRILEPRALQSPGAGREAPGSSRELPDGWHGQVGGIESVGQSEGDDRHGRVVATGLRAEHSSANSGRTRSTAVERGRQRSNGRRLSLGTGGGTLITMIKTISR